MQIRPKPPTVKNPPEQFTGDVWFDVIASPQHENQRMVVGIVRFAPGARTAPGTATPVGRRCTSPRASPACRPAAPTSSKCGLDRRCIPHPGRNTGTAPPRTTSWSTSPCTRTAPTPRPPRTGDSTSPTRNTTPARTEPHQSQKEGTLMIDQPRQVGSGRRTIGDVAPKLAELTDDVLFKDVWNRPELSARDRSLITLTALITGGNADQLAIPPRPGPRERSHTNRASRSHHSPGVLCRLAQGHDRSHDRPAGLQRCRSRGELRAINRPQVSGRCSHRRRGARRRRREGVQPARTQPTSAEESGSSKSATPTTLPALNQAAQHRSVKGVYRQYNPARRGRLRFQPCAHTPARPSPAVANQRQQPKFRRRVVRHLPIGMKTRAADSYEFPH